MRLLTGSRIGQSGNELATAVFFSFFIHVILFFGVFYLSLQIRQRAAVPPFYRVNLVDLSSEAPQTAPAGPPSMQAPSPPSRQPVQHARPKAAAQKARPAARPAAVPKNAMPELGAAKGRKEAAADEKSPEGPAPAGKRQEAVSVAVAGGGAAFPFPPYVVIVRDKVERNWNPPPGVKGASVKVLFTVLRSGRVGDAKLLATSGNFYFDQAAMRAILSSSPFPPLPEGFFKEQETFSVDLMEKE